MSKIFLKSAMILLCACTSFAMDESTELDYSKFTPCPFLNLMLRDFTEKENITEPPKYFIVTELSLAGEVNYGANKKLTSFLGNQVANDGFIEIKSLLDPTKAPAHKGSLARFDAKNAEEFSIVDTERLEMLISDERFFSLVDSEIYPQRSSFKQLKDYQKYCWSLSDMSLYDRSIGKAELHLLWEFFEGSKIVNEQGIETIPTKFVYAFLKEGKICEDFAPNEDNATIFSTLKSVINICY